MKIPPNKKPIAAGNQAGKLPSLPYSIEGCNKDQKLAAIIMPAANPCIDVSIRLFTDLNINTEAAPNAVSSQVIIPATSACK